MIFIKGFQSINYNSIMFFMPLFRCQNFTADVTAQCNCWFNQTILIKKIKDFGCNTKAKQKEVTNFKV